MAITTSTNSDLQTAPKYHKNFGEFRAKAGRSQAGLNPSSPNAKAKAGTQKAEPTLNDLEIELSILQSAYERFLEAGGKAKVINIRDGLSLGVASGVFTLEIHGVNICPIDDAWTTETKCPQCGKELGCVG